VAVTRVDGQALKDAADWRLGVAAWSFNRFTLYEAAERTSALGIPYLEAFEGQRVHLQSDAKLDPSLSDAAHRRTSGQAQVPQLTLTSIYIHELSAEEPLCRRSFELAHKLGVETIISEPKPEALNLIERLCGEFNLNVALHNHPQGSSRYWHPREILRVLDGRSPRLGACADLGHWQRSGIPPVEGIRLLGSRLLSLHVKDLNEAGPDGHDVWWGTGQGDLAAVFREVHRAGIRPTVFAIEYEHHWEDNRQDIAECARFFREQTAAIVAATQPPDPLFAGWASTDITPPRPVALVGQMHKRISTGVRDPLTATVLALETRGTDGRREPAILVSADLIMIPRVIQDRLREMLRPRLPDFDPIRLFLFGTHTHTAPGLVDDTFGELYDVSGDPGVMKASEYADFFLDRVGRAVELAWKSRGPARMGWAMEHAVTGFNRRSVYADGRAVMYGNTAEAGFSHTEGGMDTAVDVLGFWGEDGTLRGVVVNAACPSQEVEGLSEISADFWHDLRLALRARHGEKLFVLPQCAPSGDLSPHPIYRQRTEQLMDRRRGLSRRQVIARRLAHAVEERPGSCRDRSGGSTGAPSHPGAGGPARTSAGGPTVLPNRFRAPGRDPCAATGRSGDGHESVRAVPRLRDPHRSAQRRAAHPAGSARCREHRLPPHRTRRAGRRLQRRQVHRGPRRRAGPGRGNRQTDQPNVPLTP
jgi:sugar phosphate isomerase/epimerase